MPRFKITGTAIPYGAVKPATRRRLDAAVAKANRMRLSGLRDVRIWRPDGSEIEPIDVDVMVGRLRHFEKIRTARNAAFGLIAMPTVMFFPAVLVPFADPSMLLQYWEFYAVWFGIPYALGIAMWRRATRLVRDGLGDEIFA